MLDPELPTLNEYYTTNFELSAGGLLINKLEMGCIYMSPMLILKSELLYLELNGTEELHSGVTWGKYFTRFKILCKH